MKMVNRVARAGLSAQSSDGSDLINVCSESALVGFLHKKSNSIQNSRELNCWLRENCPSSSTLSSSARRFSTYTIESKEVVGFSFTATSTSSETPAYSSEYSPPSVANKCDDTNSLYQLHPVEFVFCGDRVVESSLTASCTSSETLASSSEFLLRPWSRQVNSR